MCLTMEKSLAYSNGCIATVVLGTFLFFKAFSPTDGSNVTYMSHICRTNVYGHLLDTRKKVITTSMVLELLPSVDRSKETSYTDYFKCISTFTAEDPKMRLLLHFEELKIDYRPRTMDRLEIWDGAAMKRKLSPDQGLFGNYSRNKVGEGTKTSKGIRDYESSSATITLRYIGKHSKIFPGFKIVFTAFSGTIRGGNCSKSQLLCDIHRRCISSSLQCDGHQNCGENDMSDEEKCSNVKHKVDKHTTSVDIAHPGLDTMDLGLIMACIIGIFIPLVVVLWLSVLCIKRKRLQRHLQDVQSAARGMLTRPSTLTWPRGLRIPQLAFFQPPPLYTERPPDYSTLDPKLDPPPAYSTIDRSAAPPSRPARVMDRRRRGPGRARCVNVCVRSSESQNQVITTPVLEVENEDVPDVNQLPDEAAAPHLSSTNSSCA